MGENLNLLSLQDAGLAQSDTQQLVEIMYQCSQCSSLKELRGIMYGLHRLIPFDYMVSAMIKSDPLGFVESYEITNVSYPDEWLKCYAENGFEHIDPVVIHHCKNFGLTHWDQIPKYMSKKNKFWKSAHDFNLTNGIVYGLRNNTFHGGSLFSFSGNELHHKRHEVIIQLLVPHFDVKIREFTKIPKSSLYNLTPRELEVLKWIKEGKSNWDIAVILSINERTVKFHVSSILSKLNVINRSQAIAVALSNGLVEL